MVTKQTKILHKRGPESRLPILDASELAFTTDTNKLFYGTGTKNIQIATQSDVDVLSAAVNEAKALAEAAKAAAK